MYFFLRRGAVKFQALGPKLIEKASGVSRRLNLTFLALRMDEGTTLFGFRGTEVSRTKERQRRRERERKTKFRSATFQVTVKG